ncbi:Sjogren'S syndrome/scleroderma autoantigen 1 [Ostertagia ostertagi]
MGELLLRGVTMLDAYCQTCSGILMEDRSGVRTCVTCELFAERTKEGSRLVAEVPLDTTADGVTPGNSALSEEQPTMRNVVRVTDVDRKNWAERIPPLVGSKESTPSAPTTSATAERVGMQDTPCCFDGCNRALLAIDRKLKWASERIDRSENPSEIREMFALVNEGLNIIRHAKFDR